MPASVPLNADKFAELFGPTSPLFATLFEKARAFLQSRKAEFKRDQEEWAQALPATFPEKARIEELFINHSFLILLVKSSLIRFMAPESWKVAPFNFHPLEQIAATYNIEMPVLPYCNWIQQVPLIEREIVTAFRDVILEPGDLFQKIYQQMSSPATRHSLGEFYTPPTLARLMVAESYAIGMQVLDPSCGSGTFLVEIISAIRHSTKTCQEQCAAINNIYGIDVHPIAVLVTQANILLSLQDFPNGNVTIHVKQGDFLFPGAERKDIPRLDLLIGNPPWLVLNSVTSLEVKQRIKDLASQLGIMMGGKNATHTELTALFFYFGALEYLKDGGRIFFVTTAGLITGDQHMKFRQFRGLGNIFFWIFNQDLFRIHNICLSVQKINQNLLERLNVRVFPIHATENAGYITFTKGEPSAYVPCNLPEIKSEGDLVGRLIPRTELEAILPAGMSPYSNDIYQGASIVPRNFFFVDILARTNASVTIHPKVGLQEKPPWTSTPYSEATIESNYIFPIARSLELVPFKLLTTMDVFLPIERPNYDFDPKTLQPLARQHFKDLRKRYNEFQKAGASITDLWQRINYNRGLTNASQRGVIKVIFPGSGVLLKAAVIPGDVIVDTTCYYYSTTNRDEAYYLTCILNSHSISEDLGRRGSTGAGGGLRHFHKKPLEYYIPRFDIKVALHRNIAQKGAEMTQGVNEFVGEWKETTQHNLEKKHSTPKERINWHPRMIQNAILKHFLGEFQSLDALVLQLIKEGK